MPTTQKISHKFVGAASILLMTSASILHADETIWQDIPQQANAATGTTRSVTSDSLTAKLEKYRLLALDEERVRSQLVLAGSVNSPVSGVLISLPLPDGSFAKVEAKPINSATPEITKLTPDYQAWEVKGTDGKITNGIIDISSAGFYGMINLANGDTVFIDPEKNQSQRQYASFSKRLNAQAFSNASATCQTQHDHSSFSSTLPLPKKLNLDIPNSSNRVSATNAADPLYGHGVSVLVYNLVVSSTDEFTRQNGGTRATALTEIRRIVDRVNLIMKTDLSIQLRLVGDMVADGTGRDNYTSRANNPAGNDGLASILLGENENEFSRRVPAANYDIGHLFSGNNIGGLAEVQSICGSNSWGKGAHFKARGVSGSSKSPGASTFDLDVVAHELGHQLGANHTFNTNAPSCIAQRASSSAAEPGGGSTIMAYSGLRCGTTTTDPLRSAPVDSMYHTASIHEILNNTHYGVDSSCADLYYIPNRTNTGTNRNPTVSVPSAVYTIPARTPFILTGTGSDPDGDALNYSWEQINLGKPAPANVDLGDNPIIRAIKPQVSPVRTIPAMTDLIKRVNTFGEVLPIHTNRSLFFSLNARDGIGGLGKNSVRVDIAGNGTPFRVTSPTSTTLTPNSNLQVRWDVAGTDLPPINCKAVEIALTTNNGSNFTNLSPIPTSDIANDGLATVRLPPTLGATNRIRVKCSGNIFFSLSATTPHIAQPK